MGRRHEPVGGDVDAADRRDELAAGDHRQRPLGDCVGGRTVRGQPGRRGEQRRGQRRRLGERLREPSPAGLFEDADELDVRQPETAVVLRDEDTRRAQLGEHRPAFGRPAGAVVVAVDDRAEVGGRALAVENLADGRPQFELLFGEREPHAG